MIEQGVDSQIMGIVISIIVLTIVSMMIERILNFSFTEIAFVREFLEKKANRKKSKPFINIILCLLICGAFQADIFSVIFPNAEIYQPSEEQIEEIAAGKRTIDKTAEGTIERVKAKMHLAHTSLPEPSIFGILLTAALLASGSAGMIGIMQETLGMSRDARKTKENLRKIGEANARVGAGGTGGPKISRSEKTGFGGTR